MDLSVPDGQGKASVGAGCELRDVSVALDRRIEGGNPGLEKVDQLGAGHKAVRLVAGVSDSG